jgi:XTP/dITP diphosphohydrolase
MKLLIATSNPGKMREYRELLAGVALELISLQDLGLGDMDVEESGTTLEDNASLKARAYAEASGFPALADDTGLFVDALDGRPGVYPARYGGPDLTMAQRRQKLLGELDDTPPERRTAHFACVIALALPDSESIELVRGTCAGQIGLIEEEGGSGFGYDAIFIPQGYEIPWSQVPMAEKNAISHRGRAVQQMIPILRQLL